MRGSRWPIFLDLTLFLGCHHEIIKGGRGSGAHHRIGALPCRSRIYSWRLGGKTWSPVVARSTVVVNNLLEVRPQGMWSPSVDDGDKFSEL